VTGPKSSRPAIIASDMSLGGLLPDPDHLLVALFLGDEATLVLAGRIWSTWPSAAARRLPLSGGIVMSLTAMVIPPRVANSKPTLLMPSTRCAVSSGPRSR